MKRFLKHFRYGQKGFTLIELLVVIGILGAIAAVVVPNVGKFIGRGKTESYETELHDIQTSVMAMLVDSIAGKLDQVYTETSNMATIKADTGAVSLDMYLTGLGDDPITTGTVETTCTKTGCAYVFAQDGTVTQILPENRTP
jgi:type IV pilus assembly protein PilA